MSRRPRQDCPCCAPGAFGRREVLRAGLGAALGCLIATAPALALPGPPRRLNIRRAHTEDSFEGAYWEDGRYLRDALGKLDWVLRDLSAAEVTPMDPRLFDVMHSVAQKLESHEHFEVISGYRSPERNAGMAARSSRVSTVSLHMSGMAADLRLPGRDSYGMARLAAEMQLGGVGLYRRDGFVHLDCGQPRRW